MGFVHLHIHTEYSLLKSTCRIEQLVSRAKALKYHSLALTDQNVLYGAIPFYKACIREGIKPIIGIELHIVKQQERASQASVTECILLAKNYQGYQNLLKLSTEANLETYRVPAVDKDTLLNYTEGLILILNYQTSDVSSYIIEGREDAAVTLLNQYKEAFGSESVYLEIQCHSKEDLAKNQHIVEFSKKINTEVVASNHVHFLRKEDVGGYKIVNAIRGGNSLVEEEYDSSQYYLKSELEMIEVFDSYSDAISNSERIARECNVSITLGQMILPQFPVPDSKSANEYLRELCNVGLENKYPILTQEIKDRLNYELFIITKMNFSDYFLIVWDFMRFAHEANMITGPGRGSAAGSIVAYVLNITNIDPIKYELLFERFLNPERVTMPDIDIDFPDHRREEVIEYVKNKYGKDHVAQIITFGTLAAKAAIRDVGRVLQIDSKLIDRIARLIPSVPGKRLANSVKEIKELENLMKESTEAKRLIQLAELVEGLPRHSSTHAAGIVMSAKPLTNMIPLQAGQAGIFNTQFPMDILEEIGLLKMDFLGLRNLTLIEQIIKYVQYYEEPEFNLQNIPMDDPRTFKLLSEGDTTGVFQLESDGMRRVLTMLKPTEFEDIVAVIALYRPGPMEYIPHYIEAKHGKRKVSYPHPSLESILCKTYGVIVYQEQIMQIASKMAGFTLGEADLLRRAVSKKKKDILETEREHFVKGALGKGYAKEEADHVYDMIVRFADYGFNRSHAVAYSMIAYQLAYLKATFPLAFYASLLSSAIYHQEKLQQYMSEAKLLGVTVLPPCVNESLTGFAIRDGEIRFGLAPIRHLGEKACIEIIAKRKDSPYRDLFDFCSRIDLKIVTKRGIESLISSGCFDRIDDNRAKLLASLGNALDFGQMNNECSGNPLFSIEGDQPVYIEVPPFTVQERLKFEKEAVGFYISGHPVQSYSQVLEGYNRTPIIQIQNENKTRVYVSGLVEKVKRIKTKKGESMAFVTLSDETGELETTVFPQVYTEIYALLEVGQLLFLEMKIEKKEKLVNAFITKAKRLDDLKIHKKNKRLFLKIEEKYENTAYLEKLKTILQENKGTDEVYLYYERDKKTIRLSEKYSVNSTEQCLEQLQGFLGIKNVVIKRI